MAKYNRGRKILELLKINNAIVEEEILDGSLNNSACSSQTTEQTRISNEVEHILSHYPYEDSQHSNVENRVSPLSLQEDNERHSLIPLSIVQDENQVSPTSFQYYGNQTSPSVLQDDIQRHSLIPSFVAQNENLISSKEVVEENSHSTPIDFQENSDDSIADKDYIPSEGSTDDSAIANNIPLGLVPYSGTDTETDCENLSTNTVESSTHNKRKRKAKNTRVNISYKRNRGLQYTNQKGRIVGARNVKPMTECRKKCAFKVTFEEQCGIFKEYWNLGNFNKRVLYLAQLISTAPKKTVRVRSGGQTPKPRSINYVYHIRRSGVLVEICKECFKKTFCETDKFIRTVTKKSLVGISGITSNDKRGLTTPPSKISEERAQVALNHINSYPAYQSHYSRRHTDKKYLPAGLNLATMYEMYKEKTSQPVSRSHFGKIFQSTGLKFKKPALDTCNTCDTLHMKIKLADSNEKETLQQQLQLHHTEADLAYQEKSKDKKNSNEERLTCTFDLQQCLPTPHLSTNVVFYKRLLWTFNFTICDSRGKTKCYMWHEGEGGRGANQIASCLADYLINLPPEVVEITLYSDTCGGQNKNSHIAAMFLYVTQKRPSLTIHHKFLVPGHTHMECDVIHAQIEKKKKKAANNLHIPRDWYNLVRNCSRNDNISVKILSHTDFLDFSKLLKGPLQLRKSDTNGDKFIWRAVKWFSYGRTRGQVQYKTSLKEEEAFNCISFSRRGKENITLEPEKCYKGTLSISKEKKRDLISILHLIDKECHAFYQSLSDDASMKDVDYDCNSDDGD